MIEYNALKENLKRYKQSVEIYKEKMNNTNNNSKLEFLQESIKKLNKEIDYLEEIIKYSEEIYFKRRK
jgi:peptidoglycan hydrolase CwlO-like protein